MVTTIPYQHQTAKSGRGIVAGSANVKYQVRNATLPVAVYREIAAHLQQVDGVETGLLTQTSHQFDYQLSQVGSLWIEYSDTLDEFQRERLKSILEYYSDRYGAWETL
jgi:hypothetical protein